MALDLKLDIHTTDDCRNLVIEDITGSYSEDNPGGWGGFNITSTSLSDVLLFINVYHYIGEDLYSTPISFNISQALDNVSLITSNDYNKFKMSLSHDDIYLELFAALETQGIEIPEDFKEWLTVEDNIYDIKVYSQEKLIGSSDFLCYCNSELKVNSMLSSIDVKCKDCDDSDYSKALMAKSLLETFKNL